MPSLSSVVRALDTAVAAVSLGGRTILSLDTNAVPADWDHITKVDPEPAKSLPLAYPLYLQHSSAVSVGGSNDVTGQTTEETFDLVNAADIPSFHEPSAARHVTDRTRDQADFLAIPEVLNGDAEALVGTLGEGIEYAREELAPALIAEKLQLPLGDAVTERLAEFAAGWLLREAVFEAYIIMNPDSAAAREANVTEADLLSPRAARQRAMAAEHHLESEIVYLEYSGTFGGEEAVELLSAIDDALGWPRLWYGGGLASREQTSQVLDAGADAVVVGDVFHEIADEEADLYERATAEIDGDADTQTIEEWIESAVDIGETSAARYLSTIEGVRHPDRDARRYLAAGVKMALELRAIDEELSGETESAIRQALSTSPLPGDTAFEAAIGTDARSVALRLCRSVLADHNDVDIDDGLACRHLAIELEEN